MGNKTDGTPTPLAEPAPNPFPKEVSEEIFDVVNERDEVTGQQTRSEVHRLNLRHRAVHVLLINSRGEYFLQQRSLLKDNWPGVWDSSSSGHLDTGESYDACAVREVREELGITLNAPAERILRLEATSETGWEFCWVYRARHEGPFSLQVSEVRGGGWFTVETIRAWMAARPDDFASCFRVLWNRLHS
ncbi:MAG: NUDIX domain-containing protein [Verrucomicrobiota bacterium]